MSDIDIDTGQNEVVKDDFSNEELFETEECIQILCDLGLTPIQSRVFLRLVNSPGLAAKTIVQSLNVNRVDVYRALKHLQTIGLVETSLGFPNRHIALRPKLAVKLLLDNAEKNLNSLRNKAKYLDTLLGQYNTNKYDYEPVSFQFYRLKSGRAVVETILSLTGQAQEQVRKIVNCKAMRFHLLYGMMEKEQQLADRGVKIRLICDYDTPELRDYSKVAQIRFKGDISGMLRYIIIDDRLVIIGLGGGYHPPSDSVVQVTNNKTLIQALSNHFEETWS